MTIARIANIGLTLLLVGVFVLLASSVVAPVSSAEAPLPKCHLMSTYCNDRVIYYCWNIQGVPECAPCGDGC